MGLRATWRCAAVHPSTSAPRELPRQRGARRAAIGARAMYGVVALPSSVELRGAARGCGHLLRVDGEGYGPPRCALMAWRFVEPNAAARSEWLRFTRGRVEYDPGAPLALVARRAWRRGSPSPSLLGICRVDRGTHGGARLVGLGRLPSRLLSSIPLRRSVMVRLRGGDRSLQMVRGKRVEVEQGHTRGAIVRRILRARWRRAHQERGLVIVSGPAPSRRKEHVRASGRRAFCSSSGLEAVDNASA